MKNNLVALAVTTVAVALLAMLFMPVIATGLVTYPIPLNDPTATPTVTPTRKPPPPPPPPPPTRTPTPTPTATPTPTPTNTPVVTADDDWPAVKYPRMYLPFTGSAWLPSTCGCAYDAYDCADFASEIAAQLCFNECASRIDTGQYHSDLHRLDPNQDGFACSQGDN